MHANSKVSITFKYLVIHTGLTGAVIWNIFYNSVQAISRNGLDPQAVIHPGLTVAHIWNIFFNSMPVNNRSGLTVALFVNTYIKEAENTSVKKSNQCTCLYHNISLTHYTLHEHI